MIGILTCIAFLHNLVFLVVLKPLMLYFSFNTVIYGVVAYFFIRHKLAKDRLHYLTCHLYFKSYVALIYVLGNIWNFVFWYCMPDYLAEACDYEQQCIAIYQEYAFWVWVGTSVASSYFAFVLREYTNRINASLDMIEEQLIEAKIQEIQELRQSSARS